SESPYSQGVATWVGAEIEVTGDDIQIVEDKFDGSSGRSMTLGPDSNGNLEIAVLNLPPFVPPSSAAAYPPAAGKHFEAYYDLMTNAPAQSNRFVAKPGPSANAPAYDTVAWSDMHPQQASLPDLL